MLATFNYKNCVSNFQSRTGIHSKSPKFPFRAFSIFEGAWYALYFLDSISFIRLVTVSSLISMRIGAIDQHTNAHKNDDIREIKYSCTQGADTP